MDASKNQKMTYSEIVHLLSSHMIPVGGDPDFSSSQPKLFNQQISVLEKFVNDRKTRDRKDGMPSTSSVLGLKTNHNDEEVIIVKKENRIIQESMLEED
jgi:hypothetical protein